MVTSRNGLPGAVEPFIPDYTSAYHLLLGLLAALHERERTGIGRQVEISMTEAQMNQLPEAFIDASMHGRAPHGHSDDPEMAPHGYYPCAGDDRWIAIAVATDEQWQALCRVLDAAGLAADQRFATTASRLQHREQLDAAIAAATAEREAPRLQAELQAAGIAAGAALTAMDSIRGNEHLESQGAYYAPDQGEAGSRRFFTIPYRLSSVETRLAPAPRLGQDTEDILCNLLGHSQEDLERLRQARVVG
jgi:benzylsuccinate CoA-transferase BbsF subunit